MQRRYSVKALDRGDKRAALPPAACRRLYQVEAEIENLDPDARLAERQARSRKVWDALSRW